MKKTPIHTIDNGRHIKYVDTYCHFETEINVFSDPRERVGYASLHYLYEE